MPPPASNKGLPNPWYPDCYEASHTHYGPTGTERQANIS